MPRMPVKERRERLIEAAIKVIAEDGVGAATTRAIVAEADMPLASFHYVFESHAELMAEAMRRLVDAETVRALSEFVQGPDGPDGGETLEQSIAGLINAYLNVIRAGDSRQVAVLELVHYSLRTPGQESLAEDRIVAARLASEKLLTTFAERARVRWTQPTHMLAKVVVALTDGLALSVAVGHDVDDLDTALPILVSWLRSCCEPIGA